LAKLYREPAKLAHVLSENASARFNLPIAEDQESKRKDTLVALRRGWIDVWPPRESGRDAIESELAQGRVSGQMIADMEIGLTPRGGAAWERIAMPAWKFFFAEADPSIIKSRVWIAFEAIDRDWLLNVDQTFRRFGFFIENDRRLVRQRKWRPLYWKRPTTGYSLRIDTGSNEYDEMGKKFLRGLTFANEDLDRAVSLFSTMWDAHWVVTLRGKRAKT